MNCRAGSDASAAILHFDAVNGAVVVRHGDPALLGRLREAMASCVDIGHVLCASVAPDDGVTAMDLPRIAGTCAVLGSDIVFTPWFPFEPGMRYRAVFDPRGVDEVGIDATLTLAFSLPAVTARAPVVLDIFPSAATLPENLLRLYVLFSEPMQRGCAERQIAMLTADGQPAVDVLYRAPVELWDSSMRCLTILLDPGRLKRGVGPHRALGPPLAEGAAYTLSVGAGMTGAFGATLRDGALKRFHTGGAVREPVNVGAWTIAPPRAGTREALVLTFPRPLDWAMLHHAVDVMLDGARLHGTCEVGVGETTWRFTPASNWAPGRYGIEVAADLEDSCGNDLRAAFDRPLRTVPGPAPRVHHDRETLCFEVAAPSA